MVGTTRNWAVAAVLRADYMRPFLHSSSKRLKYVSALSPKCKRTFETSSGFVPPRIYGAPGKAVVPRTAQPGSISDYWAKRRNRSSYGIGMLAKVICEQLFVFTQSTPRKGPTERSKLGMELHKEFLQFPMTDQPYKPRELPFTTPEEEAAHIFIYVPAAIRGLLKYNTRPEFKLFGHHFGRAFDGSIDSVEKQSHGDATVLRLHEIKTSVARPLDTESLRRAQLQTSLYVFFLREMLKREPLFDFEAYFTARGLDPNLAFNREFALVFPSHQVPDMNPERLPPENLNTLVDQWRTWLNTLPKIFIDKNVYITTLKVATISRTSGFGQRAKVEVKSVPHDVDAALKIAQTAIDLLDGNKTPKGLDETYRPFCQACEFHTKCPWTPELWSRPVQPLRIPIRPDEIKQTVPPIMAPSIRPSTMTSARPIETIPTPAVDPALAVDPKFEAEMNTERGLRKTHLAVLFERLRMDLIPVERKRSPVAQEVTAMKKEEEMLSVVERLRRARLAVARRTTDKRKAAQEAQKIAAIQREAQRRAQREAIKQQENSTEQRPFTGVVPYVAPTRSTTNLMLYTPSLSRMRSNRRQQKQASVLNIPIGGQAVPEDETFSAARLHVPVDTGDKWTYQFDTLPSSSLAMQQAAMTAKQVKDGTIRSSRFTDAELEELAREARRAQRRKDRGK